MGLDSMDAVDEDIHLVLPREGIREVSKIWAGDGNLIELLAMTYEDDERIRWSSEDIRRRSHRILLGGLEDVILKLPSSLSQWEKYLPVSTAFEKQVDSRLHGKILWSETLRRQGWPPQKYLVQSKSKNVSNVAISALSWLADHLNSILSSVAKISPILTARIRPQVDALKDVAMEYTWPSVPDEPDRFELHALRSSGEPWRSVAETTAQVIASKNSPEMLAFELLEPDVEMRSALFHLTTFGYLINALKQQRFSIVSESILHGSRDRPQIRAIHSDKGSWDLWYEARQMRSRYGAKQSAYRSAVRGISYLEKSIGYDVLLISPGERALILECKWSDRPEYVGRNGFHQASSYALDARNGLAKEVWAFIVGPEEIVPTVSVAKGLETDMSVVLGSTPVSGLAVVLERFLSGDEDGIGEFSGS